MFPEDQPGIYINKLQLGPLRADLSANYSYSGSSQIDVSFIDISAYLGPIRLVQKVHISMLHSIICSTYSMPYTPACCTASYAAHTACLTHQHAAQPHMQHTQHALHTSMLHSLMCNTQTHQPCCTAAHSIHTAYMIPQHDAQQHMMHKTCYKSACCTAAYMAGKALHHVECLTSSPMTRPVTKTPTSAA